MTEATLTFLLTHVLPPLCIAVLTAILTVRLSLRRFHAERWWERKAEAYSRIIEALHQATEYHSTRSCESMTGEELASEESAQLRDAYKSAQRDLRRATGIGAYIISDEIAAVLAKLNARPRIQLRPDQSVVEAYDAEFDAYHAALEQVRRLAKKDLKVP